ncbi:MAG: serine/threonine-protein kinase [Kofleriaceae bacterium]|nr:serine/threonine-protein kinase [Kofleriaceae bacterium]
MQTLTTFAEGSSPALLARSAAALETWDDEDVAELRRRVRQLALVLLAIFATMKVVYTVLFALGRLDEKEFELRGVIQLVLLGGVVIAMRNPRLSARTVLRIDAAMVGALGLMWGVDLILSPRESPMEMAMLSSVSALLFVRAFLIPSWFMRSLLVGLLAVVPVGAALAAREGAFMERVTPGSGTAVIAFSLAWLGVLVGVTAYATHVLFGLRQRVRAAQRLGRYTLERKLGEGAMGEVYLGRHVSMRRPAAIKVLRPDRFSRAAVEAFEAEVEAISSLSHPNTVTIFDYGMTNDGICYYAMEYLDGSDLERLVRAEGPLPAARVVRLLRQAAGALAEAHERGLLHRDIKPANLIVSDRGGVRDVLHILDFGLAAKLGRETGNKLVGTPGYIAPEAITNAVTDERSDLYSLGAVGYWLLTGTQVFEGAHSAVDVCLRHLGGDIELPSVRARRSIDARVEALIMACLAHDPADRPRSARALEAALAELEIAPAPLHAFEGVQPAA